MEASLIFYASFGVWALASGQSSNTTTINATSSFQNISIPTFPPASGESHNISCPSGSVIYIRSAMVSSTAPPTDPCKANVRVSVEGLCKGRQFCDLNPAKYITAVGVSSNLNWDTYYGQPCYSTWYPSAVQSFELQYTCGRPRSKSRDIVEVGFASQSMSLACGTDERVEIRASFDGSGPALADGTLKVKGLCAQSPQPNNCSYTPTKLNTVYYYCCPGNRSANASRIAASSATYSPYTGSKFVPAYLACPNGDVIDIQWAYRQEYVGGVMPGGEERTLHVRVKCHMKPSCNITDEYLVIGYRCRSREWNDLTYVQISGYPGSNRLLDCLDKYITIGEAYYGKDQLQKDVTSSHMIDRCEYRWPGVPNSFCFLDPSSTEWDIAGNYDKFLTIGYYCDASGSKVLRDNDNNNRRLRSGHHGMDYDRDTSRWRATYYTPCGEELMFGEENSFEFENSMVHSTGYVPVL